MSDDSPFFNQNMLPSNPDVAMLSELALDLSWSWDRCTDEIWQKIDPELWRLTHNPWTVLITASHEKIKNLMTDPAYRKIVKDLFDQKRKYKATETWFQKKYPNSPLKCVAYFSMEFMLSEALPIYSGGLGNVAGDQLKAAGDLGVPVVGIGLLYQQGYFRQIIDKFGRQQALYPFNAPGLLPIQPVREANGEWLRLEVPFPGYSIWLRVWEVQVGRIKLYLLDSNDPANYPAHRTITSELYGGGPDLRIMQELVLGISGWRLLEALNLDPQVCHLNEGHAAFAVLERARSFMVKNKISFEAALEATRAGNLFTTHTAVPAGFDRFSPAIIEQYLARYAKTFLGISLEQLLALGRQNPQDASEPFNMAYLAIRGSGAINGVSRLHGKVSRNIFEPLFPRWPENDIPVGYVTNGVHTPSWNSNSAEKMWKSACGAASWYGGLDHVEDSIRKVSDDKLWEMRNNERGSLVEYVRARYSRQLSLSGAPLEEIEKAKQIFDPNTLTLGFARRFATYKRPNMLLQDQERLIKILTNTSYPVQLIIAGKAHPLDKPGQDLIFDWMTFLKRPEVKGRVVFLSDYDMHLTENLVQGVDVWLNTPKRPWEACGTSGMKVLVNGGINLSELDGWWAEAYNPEVGWALGDGQEHGDNPAWDLTEANNLYDILEKQVAPEFYSRSALGLPTAWISRLRESMAQLTPHYSANRCVREYTETHYLRAAEAYLERTANQGEVGQRIVEWKKEITKKWSSLRFSHLKVETINDHHVFEARIYLDDLNPEFVKVELYGEVKDESIKGEMTWVSCLLHDAYTHVFKGSVPAIMPAGNFTPRVIPNYPGVAVPLEATQILWRE
jgi:starch phosphorylase